MSGNPFALSAMSGLIRPIHGILRGNMKREWLRMSIDIHRKIEDRFRGSAIPLVALMVFFVILAALIVAPLARALAWSVILSFITYPLFVFLDRRLFRGKMTNIAAGLNTLLILFLVILPMIGIGITIVREAYRLYFFLISWLPHSGNGGVSLDFLWSLPIGMKILEYVPGIRTVPWLGDVAASVLSWSATFLTEMSKEILGNLMRLVITLVIVTVSSFFLTRDGHLIIQFIKDVLPLTEEKKEEIFMQSRRMVQAVLYGVIFTAGVQGVLGGIGWWFCKLDNPVFFGALMFLFAMIPFIGTPAIWIPGAIFLYLHGETKSALLLLLWGGAVVSSIDNFIRPIFISEGSKAHILLIFIGILGGLATWGFLGLFIGPLILSVCVFLLDGYRKIVYTKNHPEVALLPSAHDEEE